MLYTLYEFKRASHVIREYYVQKQAVHPSPALPSMYNTQLVIVVYFQSISILVGANLPLDTVLYGSFAIGYPFVEGYSVVFP